MLVIPAIDIRNGQCVRLMQGDFAQPTVYGADPVAMAKRWQAQGAQMLHLVDLDGAKDGRAANLPAIRRIAQEVDIPIEVGGGLRTAADAESLLAAGVTRVIVGTMAFEAKDALRELLRTSAPRIVVALETKGGQLVTRGWQKATGNDLLSTAVELEKLGVQRILYTDVAKDGTLTEPNYQEIQQLLSVISVPVIASGGVSTVAAIKTMNSLGVEAAIVGKALYEGILMLEEINHVG